MLNNVEFYTDRCKGCGLCANACPKNIIIMDSLAVNKKGYITPKIEEMDKCIGCGSCFIMCPESCLKVTKA